MIVSVIVCAATIILMICGILFFPKIKLGRVQINSYWVIALLGAAVALIATKPDMSALLQSLVADTAVNPVKILVLFISMTVLSVFLDELGFFRYLAGVALRRARSGQKKLFVYLYITVSVLTVFTSNDVIILSFTPFICYFAKHAKINPMPYLAAEFVAANTWSMALIIGNPTNIYLAGSYDGLYFVTYLKISIIPTIFAGTCSFFCLYLLFRKKLSAPIEGEAERVVIHDKFQLWVGIVHLTVCTVLLAVGSYIGLQMWIVSLAAAVSLFVISAITALVRKCKPQELIGSIKRLPYELIPFILSMFVLIVILDQKGITQHIGAFFGENQQVLVYGVSSFFAANVLNNIPMSVLYSSIIAQSGAGLPAVFATVIGSNLGAYFTPVGALAGIMFSSIVNRQGLKFGYRDFLKIGVAVALPALCAALGGLYISLLFN